MLLEPNIYRDIATVDYSIWFSFAIKIKQNITNFSVKM